MAHTAPSYLLTRRLFLRLLGVVWLLAFLSLAGQIVGLVGERGIMPAGRFLEWAGSIYGTASWRQLPTVFWFGAGDGALRAVAWCGVGLAVLLVLGIAPLPVLALLWALYLSLAVAGQDFLSFQWDALLLETGLLAMVWAPATWRLGRGESRPPELARLLLVLLLFKLIFLSGATKLLSGDPTWRSAAALDFHFETQPLPPWTAWYAHQLPATVHRALTLFTLVVEVVVPWLLLLPDRVRALRIGAAGAIAALQVGIAATGNYGFFNLLTLVLCVPLLDDATLGRLRLRRADGELPSRSRARHAVVLAAFPLLVGLSLLSMVRELAFTVPDGRGMRWWPSWANETMELVAPLRSINGYGLFRVMTIQRPELILEGSADGIRWEAYDFRYMPDAVGERPRFVAPFHPRLDWQLWFAALAPVQSHGWLETLAVRLQSSTPEVLALLGRNPFPDAPPRHVRAVLYDYRFSTREERRRTGAWWARERQGEIPLGSVTESSRGSRERPSTVLVRRNPRGT
ncbi:MAG TPA: lipase maturation factor family protein [Gemmatimonadales bacterium]|nr:lipase maturation factor family protein [Gemmatimonadales bacterium]